MMKKVFAFIVLAFLAVPFVAFAQSPSSPEKSIENLNVVDIPEDSMSCSAKRKQTSLDTFMKNMHFTVLEN